MNSNSQWHVGLYRENGTWNWSDGQAYNGYLKTFCTKSINFETLLYDLIIQKTQNGSIICFLLNFNLVLRYCINL